jgi:YVTN family beta-propeller protein
MRAWRLGLASAALALGSAACAAPGVAVVAKVEIGGAGRWDYLHLDAEHHRLYLAHGSQTEVFDTRSNEHVGTVSETPGVRAIATAPDLGLGYTSNGQADTVTVFDLVTLANKGTIAVGKGPDFLVYDLAHQRLLVFNARSQDVSVIDAKAGTVLRTEPVGGEPESAVLGGNGLVYLNIENTNELVVFDPADMVVKRRHSLLPCKRPTALAIDSASRLYAACRNGLLVVSAADGQLVGSAKIGRGSDGVALLDGLAYSADGGDGTLSIVGRHADGHWATAAVVPTAYGSRTLAVDPVSKRLYLPAATFKTTPGEFRPQPVAGTLSLWVLEPR